jgi:hypothetical protein
MKGFTQIELPAALIDFYVLSRGAPPEFGDPEPLLRHRMDTINSWRRTLIRDLEFCCACELRHLHDSHAKPLDHSKWESWFAAHFGAVGPAWIARHRTGHANATGVPKTGEPSFDEDVAYVRASNQSNHSSRMRSYYGAKHAEALNGLSLLEVAAAAFDTKKVKWSGGYGGTAWRRIAETAVDLWHAVDMQDVVRLIDTAFALHHNNAIVFNKHLGWMRQGSHSWIQDWLDYKWSANSPESLLGFASPALQNVVKAGAPRIGRRLRQRQLAVPEPLEGQSHMIRLNGSKPFVAKVTAVGRGYFRTVVMEANQFKAQKTFGKHKKVIRLRAFSLREFRERAEGAIVTGWKTPTKPAKKGAGFSITEALEGLKKSAAATGKSMVAATQGLGKAYSGLVQAIAGDPALAKALEMQAQQNPPVTVEQFHVWYKSAQALLKEAKTAEMKAGIANALIDKLPAGTDGKEVVFCLLNGVSSQQCLSGLLHHGKFGGAVAESTPKGKKSVFDKLMEDASVEPEAAMMDAMGAAIAEDMDKTILGDVIEAKEDGLTPAEQAMAVEYDPAQTSAPGEFGFDAGLYFKARIAALYDALVDEVEAIGPYTLGSLLEDGTTYRFRLKNHPAPLRFYLTVDAEAQALRVRVGHTESADQAEAGEVTALSPISVEVAKDTDFLVKAFMLIIKSHCGVN